MKFTVIFIAALSVTTSWATRMKKIEEPKDKREAALSYASPGHSQSYQTPSLSHEDASAISIGAGYSIGGAKPTYSFAAHDSGASLQLPEGLASSGHASIQLAPITLNPSQGMISSDLSQLMSQLSHGFNTGALSLSPYQSGEQGAHGGQELSLPQFTFGAPKLDQYSLSEQAASSVPSYAAGTKGLGSYGATGPVLFNPASQQSAQALAYAAPSSGHSYGDLGALSLHSLAGLTLNSGHSLGDAGHSLPTSGYSLGGSGHSLGGSGISFAGTGHSLGGSGHSLGGSGHSLGGSGHSLGGSGHSLGGVDYSLGGSGYALGGSGHSLGGSGHSLSGSGHSLGGSGHSLGGSGNLLGGSYKSFAHPNKASFKPSQYLGSSSINSDSSHGLSHGAPSYPGGHGGLSFGLGSHEPSYGGSFGSGSSKFISLPSKSIAAFSSGGHLSSPPGTTYGHPSASYSGASTASHAASSHSPQYYVMSSKYPSSTSFGHGSSSYKGPVSGHSSLSSYSSGPKYSTSGHGGPSSRYASAKDLHGAYSETSYNTIKYSEELKPRAH